MLDRKTCRDSIAQQDYKNKVATGLCHWCEQPVPPSKPRSDGKGVKPRRFCNTKCSQNWWNSQRATGNSPGRPRQPGRGKRFWTYGLLEDDIEEMRRQQDYSCAICGTPLEQDENVDHCHETGTVRGLLCGSCNRGLGMFKDDIQRLKGAIAYLTQMKAG